MSTNRPESLRDIARLASHRHDGAAGRTMERLLEGTRFHMVRTTFDKILAGTYTSRPSKRTLEALAYLAGVSEERVYKAAGRESAKASFAELLPPDIDDLNDDQRKAVINVARAFLKSNLELQGLRNELERIKHDLPATDDSGLLPAPEGPFAVQKSDLDLAAYDTGQPETMYQAKVREQDKHLYESQDPDDYEG